MRLRTIKPSFFMNEVLVTIAPLGRLLFEGLWCLADRRGRLEDRPARIKLQILPADDADVDGFLNELQNKGFILRYEAEGARYIQVLNFEKHQVPHLRETESVIPPAPSIKEESESTAKAGAEHSLGDDEAQPSTGSAPAKIASYFNSYFNLNSNLVPTESRDSAEPRPAKQKPQNLAPIFDAFRAHGIRDPVFVPTSGEGKAAVGLLSKYTAEQIACCWEFVSEHGSEWERGHVSFGYLARNQVVEHWVNGELKQSTRASPNGKPALSAAAQRFVGVERTFDDVELSEAGP